ncbi:MAG: large conductance mechanosensitive channel protein MscL [Atopostipes suicloacalis]|nr:large conductance mechanosensitive channel protein MscL [Atopostipes suicloacalis]
MRGNVVELAIGLVMGTAFTNIVRTLVDSIIMPFITGLSGNASVEALSVTFNGNDIIYGAFIQAIINFLLIAIVLFFAIKAINTLSARVKKEEAEKKETEEKVPSSEDYLKEIRDLLEEQKEK